MSRTALRALDFVFDPVGAAELVQRRQLAADVAADLVELVGGDEQPVGRPGRASTSAYSSTRYSRVVRAGPVPVVRWVISTNLPMPCWAWTT